jgi:hypothetical protein
MPEFAQPSPLAIVTYALMLGLTSKLKAKGVLVDGEVTDIIDVAQLGLEQMGLDNTQAMAVHALLEQTRGFVS